MLKIKQLHALGMKRIKQLMGDKALLVHINKTKVMINCTISNIEDERMASSIYVGKQSLKFKILYSELQESKMPIKGYTYIIFNNIKYAILEESFDSFQSELILYGVNNKEGV